MHIFFRVGCDVAHVRQFTFPPINTRSFNPPDRSAPRRFDDILPLRISFYILTDISLSAGRLYRFPPVPVPALVLPFVYVYAHARARARATAFRIIRGDKPIVDERVYR